MWTSIELDIECIVCNKTLQKINHDPHGVPFKMRKITSRRSRTPNWSLEEKQYLLDLIKERKEIVVNKSSNIPNNYEEKDVAWNEILRELALKFGPKFTGFSIKKLKTQWQNMKRIAREEISLNGTAVENYTKQSFEVCNILELVKDGVLKKEDNEQFNEPILRTNIEIKTECIDEDMNEPSCSDVNNTVESQPETLETTVMDCSSSSTSGQTDINETPNDITVEETVADCNKTAQTMTDPSLTFDISTLPKEFHDFIRYTSTEKEIKMEYLKEERQIIRAMRETAELNKIIAEQKLKHVLWVKKQEMS